MLEASSDDLKITSPYWLLHPLIQASIASPTYLVSLCRQRACAPEHHCTLFRFDSVQDSEISHRIAEVLSIAQSAFLIWSMEERMTSRLKWRHRTGIGWGKPPERPRRSLSHASFLLKKSLLNLNTQRLAPSGIRYFYTVVLNLPRFPSSHSSSCCICFLIIQQ